jgi:hypothetical protein
MLCVVYAGRDQRSTTGAAAADRPVSERQTTIHIPDGISVSPEVLNHTLSSLHSTLTPQMPAHPVVAAV